MPAIASKHTSTVDTAWDGPAAKTNLKLDQTQAYYEKAFAWRDADADQTLKGTYKFIHHEVDADGNIGAANLTACSSAIGVLNGGMGGTTIPDADKKGVWEHLATHLKDGGKDVPELKSNRPHTPKGNFNVQVKALAADGTFEGKLAVYNNVDLGGDSILPGAFTKTMQERGNQVPLLWQHNADEPIGTLTLIDGADALQVKGQLLMDLDQARRAYLLLKAGVIKGLSIGFDTIKDSVENGVRQLKELRLWEGSIVTFPMNEAAMVTSVKHLGKGAQASETKDDFNSELAVTQLLDAGYQIICALSNALYSLNWASGLSREDKITAAETVIEQFSEAYLAYLPQYLDWQAGEFGDMELMGNIKREQKTFSRMLSRGAKTLAASRTLESKEGRKFSADTKKTLSAAHEHVKGLSDIFDALFDDEADDDPEDPADDSGDDTLKATAAAETKTEPDPNHSAAEAKLLEIRSLIPKK